VGGRGALIDGLDVSLRSRCHARILRIVMSARLGVYSIEQRGRSTAAERNLSDFHDSSSRYPMRRKGRAHGAAP